MLAPIAIFNAFDRKGVEFDGGVFGFGFGTGTTIGTGTTEAPKSVNTYAITFEQDYFVEELPIQTADLDSHAPIDYVARATKVLQQMKLLWRNA